MVVIESFEVRLEKLAGKGFAGWKIPLSKRWGGDTIEKLICLPI